MSMAHRTRITRRTDGRVAAGVAAGIGAHLGIEASLVRVAFGALSLAGGLGVVLYGAAYFLMAPAAAAEPVPRPDGDVVQAGGLGAVVLGLLLLARTVGLWFGDAVVWPLVIVSFGLALAWTRPRPRSDRPAAPFRSAVAEAVAGAIGVGRDAFVRVALGSALVAFGVCLLVVQSGAWVALRFGLFAAAVAIAGVALALAPALWRLAKALGDERGDRGKPVHQPVVPIPVPVVPVPTADASILALAYDHVDESDSVASLGAALGVVAGMIEAEAALPVDVVCVGDCPIDGLEPLLLAVREGIVNAVRHSGAPRVSVRLEVDGLRAVVFVRDRGRGFSPAEVAAERGGLFASVVDGLARRGGMARVRSKPGMGCELELSLPRRSHFGTRGPIGG